MAIAFSKYSGCGNDFILIDNRNFHFPTSDKVYKTRLCHRQQGIGADGIVLLENSEKADFRMRIFNADGGEAEMCGNGIRCLMKFIRELGEGKRSYSIETMHAVLRVEEEEERVRVEMAQPYDLNWNFVIPGYPPMVKINTGVPHTVIFVKNLESREWMAQAAAIRYHAAFGPAGTNVNFACLEEGHVRMRTYERGVEGETLACGTGATAVALAVAKNFGWPSPIQILPRSQESITIHFSWEKEAPTQVALAGPAQYLFRGSI